MIQLAVQKPLPFLAVDHFGTHLQRVDHMDAAVDIGIAVYGLVAALPRGGKRLDQQLADFQFAVTKLIHSTFSLFT